MDARSTHKILPPDYELDELTRYVYRHLSHLLTAEELAADRAYHVCAKYVAGYSNEILRQFGLPDVKAEYPNLMRRLAEHGFAEVMHAAALRVVREHSDQNILHTCPKCGGLCLTPKAQCCFKCGFDWHSTQAT